MRFRNLGLALFVLAAGRSSVFALAFTTVIPGPLPMPSTVEIGLQGFDPGLGTLTAVFLDSSIEFEGQATFTNPTPDPLAASSTLRLISWVSGRPGNDFQQVLDQFFDVTSGVIAPGESETVAFSLSSSNPVIGPGSPLPGFVTPGLVLLDFHTGTLEEVSGMGFLTGLSGQVNSGSVRVTYEYAPIPEASLPEPSALLLLSSGLVLTSWAAGRRRGCTRRPT